MCRSDVPQSRENVEYGFGNLRLAADLLSNLRSRLGNGEGRFHILHKSPCKTSNVGAARGQQAPDPTRWGRVGLGLGTLYILVYSIRTCIRHLASTRPEARGPRRMTGSAAKFPLGSAALEF